MEVTGTRRSRTRRGSSLIFAVILITAITIFFVGAQELMMSSVTAQQRFEDRTKARLATESAAAEVISEFRYGLLTLPATRVVTVAGIPVTADVTDNSGVVPKTMKITTSLAIKGTTFKDSVVAGQRIDPSPWDFALFVNGSNSWSDVLTTGALGANGSAYFGWSAWGGSNTHTINGDLEGVVDLSSTRFNVTGTAWDHCPSIAFATGTWATYQAAADTIYWSNNMVGYTFTDFGPTKTHLVFHTGDLNIEGNFVGNGMIYVNGKVNIKDAITVSGGKLVIVAEEDVLLKQNDVAVNAFLFAENEFKVSNRGNTVTGAVVANSSDIGKYVTIIHDPYFTDNPSERARFKLPGYWP
ncbi:MAG: hypothetical protein M9921_06735 [Fimbriimonadaceae bacterium]|nr:hypothetical protein [Chthonomonadaceae bacterium]MCO5296533.1 hypothetical protein [Fimbriimonadaceae bacterium]